MVKKVENLADKSTSQELVDTKTELYECLLDCFSSPGRQTHDSKWVLNYVILHIHQVKAYCCPPQDKRLCAVVDYNKLTWSGSSSTTSLFLWLWRWFCPLLLPYLDYSSASIIVSRCVLCLTSWVCVSELLWQPWSITLALNWMKRLKHAAWNSLISWFSVS